MVNLLSIGTYKMKDFYKLVLKLTSSSCKSEIQKLQIGAKNTAWVSLFAQNLLSQQPQNQRLATKCENIAKVTLGPHKKVSFLPQDLLSISALKQDLQLFDAYIDID